MSEMYEFFKGLNRVKALKLKEEIEALEVMLIMMGWHIIASPQYGSFFYISKNDGSYIDIYTGSKSLNVEYTDINSHSVKTDRLDWDEALKLIGSYI